MKCFKLRGFEGFKSDYVNFYKKPFFNYKMIDRTIYRNPKDGELHVDGERLQKLCFPIKENYDIFFSHSHSDVELAKNIAIELEKNYEVKCFIDSEVWQFYEDVEEELAKVFPENDLDGIKIDIYMLLTEALFRVIINTEHFFFLETDNSIDYLNNRVTYSPWLFLELSLAKQFHKKTIEKVALLEDKNKNRDFLKIDFRTVIDNFPIIEKEDLFDISKCQNLIRQIYKKNAFENIIYQKLNKND